MEEYYKKIDKSIFKQGLTLPIDKANNFLFNKIIELGTSRKVNIKRQNQNYSALFCHVNIVAKNPVHQIRWESNTDLINSLKKEFIRI